MAGRRVGKSLAGVLAALVAASIALAQTPPADRALLESLHDAGQTFRQSLAEPNATIAAVDEARQKLEHEAGRLAGRGAGAQDQRIVDLYVAAARGYQEARNRFGADHSREHYLADVRQIETELAEADNLFQGAPPIVPAVAPPPPPPPPTPPKRPPERTVPVPPADLAPPPPVPPPMPPAHSPEPPTHATPPTSPPAKRTNPSTPPSSAAGPAATATPAPPAAPPPPVAASVVPPPTAAPAPPKPAPAPEDAPKAATAPPSAPPASTALPPARTPSAVATPPPPPAPAPKPPAAPPPSSAPIVPEPHPVAAPPPAAPVPEAHAATPSAPPPTETGAPPAPGPRHVPPIVSRAPVPTTPTGVRKAADKVRIEKSAGSVVDRCSLLGEVATGDVRSGVHEIGGHNFLYEDALGLARLMTVEAGGDTLLVRERTKSRVTGDAYRCSPDR